ncbi:MAG TPA: glycosyltransferase [Steroidobacteraceae bacterium]|nr:glycosyltransferase [Steroidobacteraceae bacterium]
MTRPLVSVILPAYNRLPHLRAAIESVHAQTLADWELIIADDGSDGEAQAYLSQLTDARIRVLRLPHSGNPSAVRNAAIRNASGEFLAFLDSDDLWLPHKLERQLALMSERPTRRWSYTQIRRIDASGNDASSKGVVPWRALDGDIIEPLLRLEALIATPSVIADRNLVLEAGGFDEQQRFCEDYDLWLRLAMRSEASAFADTLACVRVHADNYSQDRIGAHEGWLRLYSKYAGRLDDPRLRAICRQRRATSGLTLAALYGHAGRSRRALRAFADSAADGWSSLGWWPRAARTLLGLLVRPLRR